MTNPIRPGNQAAAARVEAGIWSRRQFLSKSAAAGALLAVGEVAKGVGWSQMGSAGRAPITIVTQTVSADVDPRGRSWIFITEILRRAGLFFDELAPEQLDRLDSRSKNIVLLAGNLRLSTEQRAALTNWVKQGGAIIGLGGSSGLDEVFGIKSQTPMAEGWLKVSAPEHPVVAGLRSSLHVFGGHTLKPSTGVPLVAVEFGVTTVSNAAILENNFGRGRALVAGPDLIFSIVHIQQGIRVLQDGKPAPDGSALVNEGMLKAEDGMVLDWQKDRSAVAPDQGAIFLEPVSDELREIILRGIFHLARRQGIRMPMLWYWPGAQQAVGMISHDSDGNEPSKAVTLFEFMKRAQVQPTWCMLYPGGYPADFYRQLKEAGHEIGLHFDAMNGGAKTSWSKENFLFQQQWLLKTAGLEHITTNKNHYTRWEGRLDLLRWCEAAGIKTDQTRGPSKKGTIGFPLGGSQPYFPLDDEAAAVRYLKVLEVNLFTQDAVITCPPEYGRQLLDSAFRHNGVGHFLFHPAYIEKPGVADALGALLEAGRSRGMPWWTSREIYAWESLRRGVKAEFSEKRFTLRPGAPVQKATLLVLDSDTVPAEITVDGQHAKSNSWKYQGFDFEAVTVNLTRRVTVRIG